VTPLAIPLRSPGPELDRAPLQGPLRGPRAAAGLPLEA